MKHAYSRNEGVDVNPIGRSFYALEKFQQQGRRISQRAIIWIIHGSPDMPG